MIPLGTRLEALHAQAAHEAHGGTGAAPPEATSATRGEGNPLLSTTLDHLAHLEGHAQMLAALLPTSREPARILASVAALRRQATPRKPLPTGWKWNSFGHLTRFPAPDACDFLDRHIATAAMETFVIFSSEDPAACLIFEGHGVDHEDARLAAEDYLWAHGWPT